MFEVTIKDLHLATYGEVYKYFTLFGEHVKQLYEIEHSDYLTKNQSYNFEKRPVPSAVDEKDASGAEWDEKIHSANKSKTVDGLWRARRNSSAETEPEETMPEQSAIFTEFFNTITAHRASGKLPAADLRMILKDYGLEQPTELQSRQDLIPAVLAHIDEFLESKK